MNPLMQSVGQQMGGGMNVYKVMQMLRGRNPQDVFNQMMQSNPAFRSFYEANRGKTPEQVAKEHGIDLSQFKSMM